MPNHKEDDQTVELYRGDTAERPVEDLEDALSRAADEYEEFISTVADGKLYEFLHAAPKPNVVDVAKIMREGAKPPEMVLDGWLVKGELHWIFADAEAGKTWLALKLSIDVMQAGRVVVYFDEELGPEVIAARLVALGVAADVVERQFVYAPFPSWQVTDEDIIAHEALLKAIGSALALVVYDTATDAFAEADLDENSGVDVTRWVKAYPEAARRLGVAQLVLDHVGHGTQSRAVGSRAKKAKSKVQYQLKTGSRYDRTTLGDVKVTVMKNTTAAPIENERVFRVGGDGEGFVWKSLFAGSDELEKASRAHEIRDKLLASIAKRPGMNQSQVYATVSGASRTKADELIALVDSGAVETTLGPRNALLYFPGVAGAANGSSTQPPVTRG